MKILITGSSGFIGRRVSRRLADAGHKVVGFDLREPLERDDRVEHHTEDLLNRDGVAELISRTNPEVVVHLAAKIGLKEVPSDSPHFAANTVGTKNLMEAMAESASVRRAVFVSTKYVFRGPPPVAPRTYKPNTAYGRTKAAMEEMIWEADGAVPEWCIARPTTIWGPGMSPHYCRFLRLIREGRYVHFGGGRSLKQVG